MLGLSDAKVIKEAINHECFNGEAVVSLEDVAQMQIIPGTRIGDSITVLALQYGDLTILAWVQFTEIGMRVRKVRKQAW